MEGFYRLLERIHYIYNYIIFWRKSQITSHRNFPNSEDKQT